MAAEATQHLLGFWGQNSDHTLEWQALRRLGSSPAFSAFAAQSDCIGKVSIYTALAEDLSVAPSTMLGVSQLPGTLTPSDPSLVPRHAVYILYKHKIRLYTH